MHAITSRVRQFARDEQGTATLEFCIAFPVVMFLFVLGIESGLYMMRNVMLERAVDIVVRELRLDKIPRDGSDNVPVDAVKELICDNTIMIPGCKKTILINLQGVDMVNWTFPPQATVTCKNNPDNIKPAVDYLSNPTSSHQVMLMRVCVEANPVWGAAGMMAGMKKSSNGTYWLTSISAFVNEPT